ncbi:MAG: ABC transporter ATP-binding protein [Spirochaetales bacterium]|nr:ABC transporter ATP-binding protein [Spirochaetales bacterium]
MTDAAGRNYCIRTDKLTRKFGDLTAVDHLSLNIPAGEIYGFLGPNGSGKSTSIRLICGLLSPSSGKVEALGYSIPRQAEKLKSRLGYMTQKFSLYQDLSVDENLRFIASIQGLPKKIRESRIRELRRQFHLEKNRDQLTGTMSGGQKQRLALAAAIIHNPSLLILDEPTSAVDPESRREFWEYLFELVGQGMSILVSTHYMDEAERCHRLAIIQKGRLRAEGEPRKLMSGLGAEVFLAHGRSDELIHWRKELVSHNDIPGCTQIGNSLRIMITSGRKNPEAWLSSTFPFLGKVEQTRPNLEDVFVKATHQDHIQEEGRL